MQLKEDILSHTDSGIPIELYDNNTAKAYYGLSIECYKRIDPNNKRLKEAAKETAIVFDDIICSTVLHEGEPVIDWQSKTNLINPMKLKMEDFLIDVIKREREIPLTFDDMDLLIDQSVEVAKKWLR